MAVENSHRSEALIRFAKAATSKQGGELPAFPAVASRLVRMLQSEDASSAEVERLISQDQAIATAVLRAANSVLYAGLVPASDVRGAVMRIGFREASKLAMGVACRALFEVEERAETTMFSDLRRSLWHASLVVAYGSSLVSRELGRGNPDHIFLGGMFRHAGSLLVLRAISRGCMNGKIRVELETDEVVDVLRLLGPPLGERFLSGCRLPDAVVAIATECSGEVQVVDDLTIVRFCEALANEGGIALAARVADGEAAAYAEPLGLDADRLEYFGLQLAELAEQVKELL